MKILKSLTMLAAAFLASATDTASATTVLRAPVSELAAHSNLIVHATVARVDDHLATSKDGPFLTAVDFEIVETLKGSSADPQILQVILPGGRAYDRTMAIPGMPKFSVGEEVVLLLEKTRKSYAFTGLSQGVYRVKRDGPQAMAVRDLSEVRLVKRPGSTSDEPPVTQATLASLLKTLRAAEKVGAQ